MRRFLLSLVLGVFSSGSAACRSYTSTFLSANLSPVVRVQMSIAFVKGVGADDQGTECTGFVVASQVVVTAAHCVDGDESAFIDGVVGTRTKIDDTIDLALVSAEIAKPILLLRQSPLRPFESLTAIGYAWGSGRRHGPARNRDG